MTKCKHYFINNWENPPRKACLYCGVIRENLVLDSVLISEHNYRVIEAMLEKQEQEIQLMGVKIRIQHHYPNNYVTLCYVDGSQEEQRLV